MSFCLEFEKKDLLLHPSSRPGGGIGRRAGLKIQCPQQTCGFDSRPGYKLKIKELDENLTLFFCNPWDRGMGFLEDWYYLRKSLLITYLTIYSWKISALTRLRVSGVINR